jgi:hypothetical protein
MPRLLLKLKQCVCCAMGLPGFFLMGWALQLSTGAPIFASHGKWCRANPGHTNADGLIHFLGLCARAIELTKKVKTPEPGECAGPDCGQLCCE